MQDDQSSEHSATLTSSSTMTVSYDLGSSSHDQDSLSQDLDSISLPLSDSKLDEFPPGTWQPSLLTSALFIMFSLCRIDCTL